MTIWAAILSFLLSSLSFLVGLWGATYLQDRELRRRHLGIARALKAEASRLLSETGALADDYIPVSVLGAEAAIPQVSPWVSSALLDLAVSNSVVVRHFMDLERHLANLGVFVRLSARAGTELEKRQANLKAAAVTTEAADADSLGSALIAQFEAKRKVENAEDGIEKAQFVQTISYRHAKASIEAIVSELRKTEDSLAPGSWTHMPWKRRI
jgi:hypothetical protein